MVHKSGMEHIAYITEDVHLFFVVKAGLTRILHIETSI